MSWRFTEGSKVNVRAENRNVEPCVFVAMRIFVLSCRI